MQDKNRLALAEALGEAEFLSMIFEADQNVYQDGRITKTMSKALKNIKATIRKTLDKAGKNEL